MMRFNTVFELFGFTKRFILYGIIIQYLKACKYMY